MAQSSKLLNKAEPINVGGFIKTKVWSELNTDIKPDVRVFVVGGNYDNWTLGLGSNKPYANHADGYVVIDVDYTDNSIILDRDWNGLYPFSVAQINATTNAYISMGYFRGGEFNNGTFNDGIIGVERSLKTPNVQFLNYSGFNYIVIELAAYDLFMPEGETSFSKDDHITVHVPGGNQMINKGTYKVLEFIPINIPSITVDANHVAFKVSTVGASNFTPATFVAYNISRTKSCTINNKTGVQATVNHAVFLGGEFIKGDWKSKTDNYVNYVGKKATMDENEVVSIQNMVDLFKNNNSIGYNLWMSGFWHIGNYYNGTWHNGSWITGIQYGGIIGGGFWHNGVKNAGSTESLHYGMYWFTGNHNSGTAKDIYFLDGTFTNGEWYGSSLSNIKEITKDLNNRITFRVDAERTYLYAVDDLMFVSNIKSNNSYENNTDMLRDPITAVDKRNMNMCRFKVYSVDYVNNLVTVNQIETQTLFNYDLTNAYISNSWFYRGTWNDGRWISGMRLDGWKIKIVDNTISGQLTVDLYNDTSIPLSVYNPIVGETIYLRNMNYSGTDLSTYPAVVLSTNGTGQVTVTVPALAQSSVVFTNFYYSDGYDSYEAFMNRTTWVNGSFEGGRWVNGQFKQGNVKALIRGVSERFATVFEDSTWTQNRSVTVSNTTNFYEGVWMNGFFANGDWYNGLFQGGIWKSGFELIPSAANYYQYTARWLDGTFRDSRSHFVIGEWLGGTFTDSANWHKGVIPFSRNQGYYNTVTTPMSYDILEPVVVFANQKRLHMDCFHTSLTAGVTFEIRSHSDTNISMLGTVVAYNKDLNQLDINITSYYGGGVKNDLYIIFQHRTLRFIGSTDAYIDDIIGRNITVTGTTDGSDGTYNVIKAVNNGGLNYSLVMDYITSPYTTAVFIFPPSVLVVFDTVSRNIFNNGTYTNTANYFLNGQFNGGTMNGRFSSGEFNGGNLQGTMLSGNFNGGTSTNATLGASILSAVSVLSILSNPPSSPSTGARYLISENGAGIWIGKSNYIAEWNGSVWIYTAPSESVGINVITPTLSLRYIGYYISFSYADDQVKVYGGTMNNSTTYYINSIAKPFTNFIGGTFNSCGLNSTGYMVLRDGIFDHCTVNGYVTAGGDFTNCIMNTAYNIGSNWTNCIINYDSHAIHGYHKGCNFIGGNYSSSGTPTYENCIIDNPDLAMTSGKYINNTILSGSITGSTYDVATFTNISNDYSTGTPSVVLTNNSIPLANLTTGAFSVSTGTGVTLVENSGVEIVTVPAGTVFVYSQYLQINSSGVIGPKYLLKFKIVSNPKPYLNHASNTDTIQLIVRLGTNLYPLKYSGNGDYAILVSFAGTPGIVRINFITNALLAATNISISSVGLYLINTITNTLTFPAFSDKHFFGNAIDDLGKVYNDEAYLIDSDTSTSSRFLRLGLINNTPLTIFKSSFGIIPFSNTGWIKGTLDSSMHRIPSVDATTTGDIKDPLYIPAYYFTYVVNGGPRGDGQFVQSPIGSFSTDGVIFGTVGQRILVKDQLNQIENGVYVYSTVTVLSITTGYLTRVDDQYNVNGKTFRHLQIYVREGTIGIGHQFYVIYDPSGASEFTLGTDQINFIAYADTNINNVIWKDGILSKGYINNTVIENIKSTLEYTSEELLLNTKFDTTAGWVLDSSFSYDIQTGINYLRHDYSFDLVPITSSDSFAVPPHNTNSIPPWESNTGLSSLNKGIKSADLPGYQIDFSNYSIFTSPATTGFPSTADAIPKRFITGNKFKAVDPTNPNKWYSGFVSYYNSATGDYKLIVTNKSDSAGYPSNNNKMSAITMETLGYMDDHKAYVYQNGVVEAFNTFVIEVDCLENTNPLNTLAIKVENNSGNIETLARIKTGETTKMALFTDGGINRQLSIGVNNNDVGTTKISRVSLRSTKFKMVVASYVLQGDIQSSYMINANIYGGNYNLVFGFGYGTNIDSNFTNSKLSGNFTNSNASNSVMLLTNWISGTFDKGLMLASNFNGGYVKNSILKDGVINNGQILNDCVVMNNNIYSGDINRIQYAHIPIVAQNYSAETPGSTLIIRNNGAIILQLTATINYAPYSYPANGYIAGSWQSSIPAGVVAARPADIISSGATWDATDGTKQNILRDVIDYYLGPDYKVFFGYPDNSATPKVVRDFGKNGNNLSEILPSNVALQSNIIIIQHTINATAIFTKTGTSKFNTSPNNPTSSLYFQAGVNGAISALNKPFNASSNSNNTIDTLTTKSFTFNFTTIINYVDAGDYVRIEHDATNYMIAKIAIRPVVGTSGSSVLTTARPIIAVGSGTFTSWTIYLLDTPFDLHTPPPTYPIITSL